MQHEMATHGVRGGSLDADGYHLSAVAAPTTAGEPGTLSFRIEDGYGTAITRFAAAHEKELHLIVVRSDGSGFRHAHPRLDAASGTWSLPWTWQAAGSYRVFADFVPANGSGVTLSRTVEVAGEHAPVVPEPNRDTEVDGYGVRLDGELVAGSARELTFTVRRDGRPARLQQYLGAAGHLVALRWGDLAYLHVHPQDAGTDAAGSAVSFAAAVPMPGRYLLYLDFRVDDRVHTAAFVLDAAPGSVAGQASHQH